MHEEGEAHIDEQAPEVSGEEIYTPTSKYERIMLAAVEAARLNEEVRRKGIKLDHKVTLEALKRVDEGKVKGVIPRVDAEIEAREAAGAPRDMLFGGSSIGFERSGERERERERPEEDSESDEE